jgi:hypothetical protein
LSLLTFAYLLHLDQQVRWTAQDRTDGELVHDQRLSAILYHGNGGGGIVVHAGRGHIVALARALDPMRRMLSKAPEKLSILDTLPD